MHRVVSIRVSDFPKHLPPPPAEQRPCSRCKQPCYVSQGSLAVLARLTNCRLLCHACSAATPVDGIPLVTPSPGAAEDLRRYRGEGN